MTPKYNTEIPCAHYLTFSCYKRLWLFKSPALYQWFLENLDRVRTRHPFRLYGFVLMPNHVHLLIFPTAQTPISSLLTALKGPYAQKALPYLKEYQSEIYEKLKVLEKQGESWRFWQAGGGYDRYIYSDEGFLHTLNYMHLNPVKKELVAATVDWKWSSARYYETGKVDLISLDKPDWR
jgi:putative transposase